MNWDSIDIFVGKLERFSKTHAYIRCSIGEYDKPMFQLRKFELAPILGAVEMIVGNYVAIMIATKPGERTFYYTDATHNCLFDDVTIEQQNNILDLMFSNDLSDFHLAHTLLNSVLQTIY